MKYRSIKKGESIDSFLGSLVNNMLQEKTKKRSIKPTVKKVGDQKSSNVNSAEIGRQKGGPQYKMAPDDVEALQAVPEMADIIDKLNAVRSGRSLKDEKIKDAFDEYYDGLDDEEKIALFAFLKGLAQVTSGKIDGDAAVEPDTAPSPGIEMSRMSSAKPDDKKPEKKKKKVKPHVIPHAEKPKPRTSFDSEEEDTSAPLPVKPVR